MGINISTTKNQVDTFGRLAKVVIPPNTNETVYYSTTGVILSTVDILVLNAGLVNATVNMWITNKDTLNPSTVDLIESNLIFQPDSVFVRSGILIDGDEKLVIRSSIPNVVVRVTGLEDRSP